ncbi:hypothetical protein Mro03_21810 [Microbispora rosea subsp. rosea]|nr:hypothetical protein Mro03_21810 [Microbispora rosea subsp. rosea]
MCLPDDHVGLRNGYHQAREVLTAAGAIEVRAPRASRASAHDQPDRVMFATVRHRTKVTKGPGSQAAGLAMAFKLIESAQARWRAVNAPHLVALVRAGATFINGKLLERPDDQPSPAAA